MNWISIKDKMPEKGKQVLAVAKYKSYSERFIEIVSWEEWLNDGCDWAAWAGDRIDDDDYEVLYWQPLPEMPKTDE